MIKLKMNIRNYANILIALALVTGLMLTLFGLSKLHSIPWSSTNAFLRFAAFLLVSAILSVFISRKLRWNTGLAFGCVAILLAIVGDAFWALVLTLLFATASIQLGYWLLGILKITEKYWLNCLLTGMGVYGTSVGLLAHFPVNYPGVYGLALALPIMLGWRVTVERIKSYFVKKNNSQDGCGVHALDVLIAVIALAYVIVALMPEVGYDPLAMHLFIPSHLALRHQWGFDASTYVWAVMPMLGDWIFSIGYMLAGETAARLINVGFIFILGWLVRDIVLWAGGSLMGARWAVLIFLSTPLTFTEGSSLFIESIWTSFAVAGTLTILTACSTSGKPKFELPIAGYLLGCALASKAVTSTLLPALLLLLVWRYKSWFKAISLQALTLGLGLFVAMGSIPYVTAWRLTGNPVFPLFNKIFKSSYFPTSENFTNPLYSGGVTWDVIYRATYESSKYLEASAGASGFQWLLLFVPTLFTLIIMKQGRAIALLFVGIAAFAITFHSQSYLRYVFPSSVMLIAAIGVALSAELSTRKFRQYLWLGITGIAVVLNLIYINAGAQYGDFPLKSAFDRSLRHEYLSTRLPTRIAVDLVNRLNVEQTPVAVFAEPFAAGLSGDALYPNWYNKLFQTEIDTVQTEQDLANILLKRNVHFVILDQNWNGVNCCNAGAYKQPIVENVTEKIAEFGTISVRKVKSDYQIKTELPDSNGKFITELLSNPNFESIKSWAYTPKQYDANAGVVLVSVDSPITQKVAVTPGRRYLNTVVARCAKEPTIGRLQINWGDTKEQFVSFNLETFECTSKWAEHTMEVTAPKNSAYAEVYVSGGTSKPLEFKSDSLRQ